MAGADVDHQQAVLVVSDLERVARGVEGQTDRDAADRHPRGTLRAARRVGDRARRDVDDCDPPGGREKTYIVRVAWSISIIPSPAPGIVATTAP